MKILVVGPSPDKSKGGMATVISEIREDKKLHDEFEIDIFESYVDGGKIKRMVYSVFAYLKFIFTKRKYDLYHIHAASRGSTFRKGYYVRTIKRWGKKVILHIHGARYMEFYNELSDKKKHTMINILKSADMVIALSEDWKDKFDNTFGLSNCVVLENGINIEKLKSAMTDPSEYSHSFVTLGRLGRRKGTYDLVEAVEIAAKAIPDIKIYLAGDGDVKQIEQLVTDKKLDHNIEVVGWVNFNKKIDLLKQVSTVVLPSYNEGLPMSILEGMACGKAIISTTVGAIPEVVEVENGILISPGDIEKLAEALVKCSTDVDMLINMSEKNIRIINDKFSMEAMHQKLSNYYTIVYKS